MKSLENGYIIAKLCQISRTGKTCGAGTNNRNLLAVLLCGSLRLNALLSGPVSYKTLQLADGHRLALNAADAASLALAFLGTYAAADSRQSGGLADNLVSGLKVAFLYLFDKIGNMYLYGTSFHTFCIFTIDAALGFLHSLILIVAETYLVKICGTDFGVLLSNRYFLQYICHYLSPPQFPQPP